MSKSLVAFETESRKDGSRGFSAKELENASIEICNALHGTYNDATKAKHKVNGDLSKVRYVKGLSEAAQKLLQRVRAVTRKIEGTNEVRTVMRYDTHAARIAQGVPLFLTLSPDEKHNLIMIRMCRARQKDPAISVTCEGVDDLTAETNRRFYAIDHPPVDINMETMSLEELKAVIPDHDTRRAMMSRDALASVDGFRTIVHLFFEYILGLSNASPEGGVLGRIDGIYGAIEAQKSAGSLHVHVQHRKSVVALQEEYASYKRHVCQEVYADVDGWIHSRKEETESVWPNYEANNELITTPTYLTERDEH
eukprot:2759731-Karenia_brevis.AAC.1